MSLRETVCGPLARRSVRAQVSCPARRGGYLEPARIMQCLLARRLGPVNAHTGLKRRLGATAELAKSLCCTIWVEQGSSTRVPLCADQARIEQRSKQIAKRGGRKQRLLVGESLICKLEEVTCIILNLIRDILSSYRSTHCS